LLELHVVLPAAPYSAAAIWYTQDSDCPCPCRFCSTSAWMPAMIGAENDVPPPPAQPLGAPVQGLP
jgi:hypothetical protein